MVLYDRENREYTRLTEFGQWPVFLPDSRRILFVTGGRRFFITDLQGDSAREIDSSSQDVLGPQRLTDDGTEMFFTRRVAGGDVWLMTLE